MMFKPQSGQHGGNFALLSKSTKEIDLRPSPKFSTSRCRSSLLGTYGSRGILGRGVGDLYTDLDELLVNFSRPPVPPRLDRSLHLDLRSRSPHHAGALFASSATTLVSKSDGDLPLFLSSPLRAATDYTHLIFRVHQTLCFY